MSEQEGEVRGHIPVLAREICELLPVSAGSVVIDATVGLGGHAALFAKSMGQTGILIGLDVDPENLSLAKQRLADVTPRVELLQANFADITDAIGCLGVQHADVVLADLGVNSVHLDQAARGFSFRQDGPLDMRMNPDLTTTASDLVNRMKERELADLFYYNAQEMKSRRIAKRICELRRDARITTTGQLAEIVSRAVGVNPESRHAKIHPATRTFQALRMAVNDEIPCLQALLVQVPDILTPGGRFGVIAFHSVEDRPVKHDFRQRKTDGIYRILTKKPMIASAEERDANPRARSAKLRVVERLSAE